MQVPVIPEALLQAEEAYLDVELDAGHWSLAGLQQPGVPQRLPSINELCLVLATQDLVVPALLLEVFSVIPSLKVIL